MRANLPDARDRDEMAAWEARDPIVRFEQVLGEAGVDEGELDAARKAAEEEIDAAVAFARAAPPASIDDARGSTYAPHVRTYPDPPPTERRIGFVAALREALTEEMAADERVVLLGEDVRMGGIFRVSEGLAERFGRERVRDTPISEAGYAGAAVGAALTGLRPVVEIQIFDFVTLTMDALVNQAAKLRFMLGGGPTVPLVVRGPAGGGIRLAAQHSQTLEAWFAHVPGLVVVVPSSPRDAKGLLAAAIRDDNPVVFLETKSLLFEEGPVPEGRYAIPLGKAEVKRPGSDVTVVATGALVGQALRAAQTLERDGISLEVVDPRTLYPLDTETLLASARKTSRVVVAHEAVRFGGIGAEIAATISEQAFFDLDAPVARVGAPHHPIPFEDALERATIPNWQSIADAVRSLL
jgi:2-oxoisovalerate dehydrogenase E1 component